MQPPLGTKYELRSRLTFITTC